jgi:hypothetical protein
MADTFGPVWRRLLIYSPELPPPLAQEWVNNAYSMALRAYDWYNMKQDGTFTVPDSYTTGTITLTQGSPTVIGIGTAWDASMVGRQLYPNSQAPVFTIIAVGGPTSLTIDAPWTGATVGLQPYEITLSYIEMPADFESFDSVYDPVLKYRLRTNWTQAQLDIGDAARVLSVGGTPWIFAAAKRSAAGLPRYELYPRIQLARTYGFRYRKVTPELIADSDEIIPPLSASILRMGALAEMELWSGTEQRPRSANMAVYAARLASYNEELTQAETEDQNLEQTRIQYAGWKNWPYAPVSASWIQNHLWGPLY